MLKLTQFKKSYASNLILDINDFNLKTGLYWIQGPNGVGKSTLFKAISGIIPFEGDCNLNNTSIKKEPVNYRKMVSYCEAEPEFPDFLTQKDLIKFVAKVRNASDEQVNQLQLILGTEAYQNQPVGTYSSGMLKKTAIVMAFLGNPKLILLDEPFTSIDHDSVDNLVALIHEYRNQHDAMFLVSSHIDSGHYHLDFDDVYTLDDKCLKKVE